ncbi:hypothetical protein ANN_00364 [Periplaneta americana]|uniref:Uncharacterized protein n=1 Tax=Periplaneta americana TaxID=6978 RepID=A0ABQ8TSE1_PERAM|nr:hypothetical protein ANN_00364 [Periplaneta americana]
MSGYLASECDEGDNAGEMSPGSSTESYPAFAHIGLRENPGKNLNQVTCPDREWNPGRLISRPDALTVTPQVAEINSDRESKTNSALKAENRRRWRKDCLGESGSIGHRVTSDSFSNYTKVRYVHRFRAGYPRLRPVLSSQHTIEPNPLIVGKKDFVRDRAYLLAFRTKPIREPVSTNVRYHNIMESYLGTLRTPYSRRNSL